jgi:DedD protein
MGLLSFLKRSKDEPRRDAPAAAGAPDAVQESRTRARRRLIGASVLLGLGIVGFPLLFETQPRPVPVDIPIEIPSKETAAPLPLPPKRASAPVARAMPPVITERPEDAGREVSPAASAPGVAEAPKADKPTATEAPKPMASASAAKPKPAASAAAAKADAERAKALLESRATAQAEPKPDPKTEPKPKPEPKAEPKPKPEAEADKPAQDDAGRFVVQVGAFADAAGARQARQKVEALGLKTYTQEVDVNGAKRIRVRVGPFASREAAAKVVGKVKAAGLPGALLTL